MSLRSPLGRVLGLGSAKGGSAHWFHQRVSAVALLLLGLWFLGSLLALDGAGYAAVVGWLRSPLSSALAALLVGVLAWHATLGLQVVIEDYVGDKGRRLVLLVLVKFLYAVAAVAGVLAVLRIGFGAIG
jgi:succinate dehydrogenase / fumarate reductase membrane anchor subunit